MGRLVGSIACFAALLLCLAAGAARAGDARFATLTPQEQVAEGEAGADFGTLDASVAGSARALAVSSDDAGRVAAFFSLNRAWDARTRQPEEANFYRDSTISTTITFGGPPPAGVSVVQAQLLNHLIIVWQLGPRGVTLVPVGDPLAFFVDPFPPYLAGRSVGTFAYGTPIRVAVHQTPKEHDLTAIQGASVVAAHLQKFFPHPDAPIDGTVILATGTLRDFEVSRTGTEEFRGVHSPAEFIPLGLTESNSFRPQHVERGAADEVRVYP